MLDSGAEYRWKTLRVGRSRPLSPGMGALLSIAADAHYPPFPAQRFSLITASFGLNATDPVRILRALRRLLVPGGILAIQEWGPMTALDQAFADVFGDCMCSNPPSDLAALRTALVDWSGCWSDCLQDTDDYVEWLSEAGFHAVKATESAPVALHLTVDQFMAYKLAWTDRYIEMNALDHAAHAACEAALRARLGTFVTSTGRLVWSPVVFRVKAQA